MLHQEGQYALLFEPACFVVVLGPVISVPSGSCVQKPSKAPTLHSTSKATSRSQRQVPILSQNTAPRSFLSIYAKHTGMVVWKAMVGGLCPRFELPQQATAPVTQSERTFVISLLGINTATMYYGCWSERGTSGWRPTWALMSIQEANCTATSMLGEVSKRTRLAAKSGRARPEPTSRDRRSCI